MTSSLRGKKRASPSPQLLIDGVAYQDACHYGIYRVWNSLLQEWARTGFLQNVKVLDRENSFPDLPGVKRVRMHRWSPKERSLDQLRLRRAAQKHGADVLVSTYISRPLGISSAFLHHDFIPERMGLSSKDESQRAKAACIRQASAHLCVSENTARDLKDYFPEIPTDRIRVAHLGVDANFFPRKAAVIQEFRRRHGIQKPYFLIVGERIGLCGAEVGVRGYKNTKLFFEAYRHWEPRDRHQIVLVGRTPPEPELVGNLDPDCLRWLPELTEDDMALAYSGAVALPYPSKYEGFGLVLLEAIEEVTPTPSATTSGLILPSSVGPQLLNELITTSSGLLYPEGIPFTAPIVRIFFAVLYVGKISYPSLLLMPAGRLPAEAIDPLELNLK
jgi:hypothetical protein